MIHYDDDARLTLAEFCAWAEQKPAYVREAEAKGIITCDEDGLFELAPTIRALADDAESELEWYRTHYRRSLKGWVMDTWRFPSYCLRHARRWLESQAGRILIWLWPIK
jgi:hypothetical protein